MRASTRRTMTSSKSAEWGTPRPFFDWLDRAFLFTVDVCATPSLAKCDRFFTPEQDGLRQSWSGETWFGNFPYGDVLPWWTKKAREEVIWGGDTSCGVMLLPSRVDTRWWRDLVEASRGRLRTSWWVPETRCFWLRWQGLRVGVYHHDQRLLFDGMADDGAPFPSSVVVLANPGWKAPECPPVAPGERPPLTLGMPP